MTSDARARKPNPGAPTVKRSPLNKRQVIECALAYVDRYGLDKLTMRRLGTALGVEGMSIYKHVADKGALLDGMAERLWADLPAGLPTPDADWRSALRHLANGIRAVFYQHPGAATLLATRNFLNVEALRRFDAYASLLEQAGFERRAALEAVGVLIGQALGYGLLELHAAGAGPAGREAGVQQTRSPVPPLPAGLPDSLVRVALDLNACEGDRCLALGVDALLAGLPDPASSSAHAANEPAG